MTVLMVPDDGDKLWPSLGPQVCAWIEENLCFGPGDLRGSPAVLDDEKRALIYRAYEIFPEKHKQAGRRRFKRVGLSLAKGLAKTELAAWIAAAELHHEAPVRCIGWEDGEPIGGPVTDPYIPMVAYTEEQSDELAYGALKAILEESPIADDFDIGLERIIRKRGDGKAVSLSTSPNARDGARTTFQIANETHWWTLDKLKKAHQTMLANLPKRKLADSWALEVTTAYEPGSGSVAESTMDYAKAVHEGRAKDAKLFFFHRQASEEHDLDTEEGARAAVLEASGPAASWRDIDGIVELWRDPTTDRAYWERVWCNRPVQGARKAFDPVLFAKLKKSNVVIPDGSLITIGFDGAQFRDATALVCTHIQTGYQWTAGAWECPYGQDEKWQVPAHEVDALVDALFSRYNVWRMYADPPYWQSWISTWQGKYGDERIIEWWTNRRTQMAAALESFETAMHEGTLSHSGDDVLVRHIGNAHRHELPFRDDEAKPRWLIRKDRSDSPYKIDAAMAAALSWEARKDAISAGVLAQTQSALKVDWLKHYKAVPTGGNRYIVAEPANEKKKQSEWSTFLVFELKDDRAYYAIDIIREKLNLAERTDLLFELHRKHKPLRVGYEQYGLETDLQHIRDRQAREHYTFTVTPLESKLSDAELVARLVPIFEAGRFVLPETLDRGRDMVAEFIKQEYEPWPLSWHTDMLTTASRILDLGAEFPSAVTWVAPMSFPSDF